MTPSLDTGVLRAFVTVAEVKSFTRAARYLGLTQSAISVQIRRLEEQLDVPLLHRHKRGPQLTAAGEAFIVHARRMLELQEEAVRSIRHSADAGDIRFGLPDVYAIRYLPPVWEQFQQVHPEVRPEIFCDVSTRIVERFDEGELDVCLTVQHNAASAAEVLGREELVWVCAPDFELPQGPLPLAVYPEYCVFRAHGLRALTSRGLDWRIVYASQSSAAIDIAINGGYAVAIKARRTVDSRWRILSEADGLPPLEPAKLELRCVPTSGRPALERFVGLLRAQVGEHG